MKNKKLNKKEIKCTCGQRGNAGSRTGCICGEKAVACWIGKDGKAYVDENVAKSVKTKETFKSTICFNCGCGAITSDVPVVKKKIKWKKITTDKWYDGDEMTIQKSIQNPRFVGGLYYLHMNLRFKSLKQAKAAAEAINSIIQAK